MELRRVVVTGLGIVSPLGCGVEPTWQRLLQVRKRRARDRGIRGRRSGLPDRRPHSLGIAADGNFDPDEWVEPKEQRKVDPFIVYAMAAATQAIADSGID